MKSEIEFWLELYGANPEEVPNYIDFLSLSNEEIDDQDLKWLSDRVKKIRRLDLKETDIGDQGIKYLSAINSIQQLNLKGTYVTEKAIEDLLKMRDLEYLYFNQDHPLAPKEIIQFGTLKKLVNLFFSLKEGYEVESIQVLHDLLPDCEIVIINR